MITKAKVIGVSVFLVITFVSGFAYYKFADKKVEEQKPVNKVETADTTESDEINKEEKDTESEDSNKENTKPSYCADIATKYKSFSGMFSETLVDKGDYYEAKVSITDRNQKNEAGDAWGKQFATEIVRISKDVVCHFNGGMDLGEQNLTFEGYLNEMGADASTMMVRMVGPQIINGAGIVTDSKGYIIEFWDFMAS